MAAAKSKIESGQAEIDKNRSDLNLQKKDLEQKLAQVEAGIAQLTQAGAPQEQIAPLIANQQALLGGLAQIAAGEKQLDAAQRELNAGRQEFIQGQLDFESGQQEIADAEQKIADGYKEVEQGEAELAVAKRLLAVTENFGTISENGLTAIATIQFDLPVNQLEPATTDAVVEAMKKLRAGTLQVEFSQALTTDFGELLGAGEIVGLIAAAIVLFVMLGSMIAAGLPVLSAILGVGISASITMALSGAIEMTSTTPILGVMLGLAVGIDYSLFLLNRHRKQLKTGMEVKESIALATGTSGNAVLFAGLTVIIALAALNLTGIGFLGLMGTMGAVAIALAVSIAITFTPA